MSDATRRELSIFRASCTCTKHLILSTALYQSACTIISCVFFLLSHGFSLPFCIATIERCLLSSSDVCYFRMRGLGLFVACTALAVILGGILVQAGVLYFELNEGSQKCFIEEGRLLLCCSVLCHLC